MLFDVDTSTLTLTLRLIDKPDRIIVVLVISNLVIHVPIYCMSIKSILRLDTPAPVLQNSTNTILIRAARAYYCSFMLLLGT